MNTLSVEEKIADLQRQITDERQHIAADRMDISFGELVNMYEHNELVIHPEYQRFFRWTNSQKTALIESILLGIPIPPIFVAEDKDGIWEIVDGLQRVSTIVSFFGKLKADVLTGEVNQNSEDDEEYSISNKWTLESGDLLRSLEGFNVDSLPQKYILNLKRSVCRVEILRGQSRATLKYELFRRLNSNGTKLTAQEIRNAIYRGIDDNLNKLIERLSQNCYFGSLTKLTKQKKKELYDQELILRFLAFYDKDTVINSNTAMILDEFMERSVKKADFNTDHYEAIFNRTISLLHSLDDEGVFKNKNNLFVPAYYDAIMIGLAKNIDRYENNRDLLRAKINELKESEQLKRQMGSALNSRSRIAKRLDLALSIFGN